MKTQFKNHLQARVNQFVLNNRSVDDDVKSKLILCEKRDANITKIVANGKVIAEKQIGDETIIQYDLHSQYFITHKHKQYIEEMMEIRRAHFQNQQLLKDICEEKILNTDSYEVHSDDEERVEFHYDRQAAVAYAEKWWNDYNPQFKKFDVDCTNYVSQCLFAGGAPMRGYPNRTRGWWMQNNNWSFSWTVANALTQYLSTSKTGLRARQVSNPKKLKLGDVICYDFQGDGRFDHTTIVTNHDADGMPLVNAHTDNSRNRYWSYEDSTAYTPNMTYKFFTIIDD